MQVAAKSRKAKSSLPVCRETILATPERARQHGGVVKELLPESPNSRVMIPRHKARCECRLDEYFMLGKLDKSEHAAGIRFRAAWLTKAEGIKTQDSTIESIGACGCSLNAIERQTVAERVLKEAYAELSPHQALIIVSVCGCDGAAGSKDHLCTLRRGLEALARRWSLV